ncbi:class IV adenylate cyclase [Streptomyces sp. PTD5-9]|uniref:class IV adenylate cyclase n=1 Tax=Streptomyces sp. PTD5-9 TaxID=3120150 RepID=UPI00300800A6
MKNSTIEVERKRELPDAGAGVRPRPAALGYVGGGPVTEVDTYYSRPDVDYLETVECLRVRRRGDFAEITYKPASDPRTHAHDDVVSKAETNVILSGDGEAPFAERLLTNIGMRKLVRVEKTRTSYKHPDVPDVTVSVDTVRGVGTFIETEVNRASAAGAADLVAEIEDALGIAGHPTVSLPYRDLVLRRAGA